MPGTAQTSKRPRYVLPVGLLVGLLAVVLVVVSAFGDADNVHVKVSKKQLLFTGTSGTANTSLQVNFDPNKCATSYTAEDKRAGVAFTDFNIAKAGAFKFPLKLPITPPTGDKAGHYACAYLLEIEGQKIKSVASAVGKY